MSTFDRMGSVWRRSTIPVTCCSGPNNLSLLDLIFSMIYLLVIFRRNTSQQLTGEAPERDNSEMRLSIKQLTIISCGVERPALQRELVDRNGPGEATGNIPQVLLGFRRFNPRRTSWTFPYSPPTPSPPPPT